MKNRIISMIAIVCVMMLGVAASAEGRISLTQEKYTLNDDGKCAYVFAKAENTGNEVIKVADSEFDLLDAAGKTLEDTESIKVVGDYLQPGESTYVYAVIDLEDIEGEVADYSFSIKGKDDDKYTSVRLDTRCALDPEDSDVALLTITNNTPDILYGVKGAVTFLDGEDIVAINSVSMLSKVGLNPGATVTMKVEMPSDFEDTAKAIGMQNLTLDAIASVNVKN